MRALPYNLLEMDAGPRVDSEQDHELQSSNGLFPVKVLRPSEQTPGVVIYVHGGGWVLGDVATTAPLGRYLAAASGMTVVVVGYRLAPEHPFPAARDDVLATLDWVLDRRELFSGRVDAPVFVAGDSAGGNLAAVVGRLRGRQLAGQVLIYPVVDASQDTPSYAAAENQLILDAANMAWFWDQYAPDLATRSVPDVSPLRADDLGNSPRTMMVAAPYDVLVDEGRAYASRLKAAGVDVEYHLVPGQMHGFISCIGILPQALPTLGLIADFLRRCAESARR